MNKKLKEIGYFVIGVVVCFLLFQLIALIIHDNYIFPNPHEVIGRFFSLFVEGKTYLYLLKSLLHLVIAIAIAFLLGSILGILGTNKIVDKILKPTIKLFKSIPIVALIIILLLITKSKNIPVITAVILLTPIFYDGIREGILSIDSTLMDVWKLDSSFCLKVFLRVYIPLTISSLKTAFMAATGLGIKAVVAGEYLAGVSNTLGKALTQAASNGEFIDLYAFCLLMVLLVVLVELIPVCISLIVKKCTEPKKVEKANNK